MLNRVMMSQFTWRKGEEIFLLKLSRWPRDNMWFRRVSHFSNSTIKTVKAGIVITLGRPHVLEEKRRIE